MALVIVAWLLGWVLLWRLPLLTRTAAPDLSENRTVSVVIPARNEADRLPALLKSLRRQTYPPDEVVVVDDHSCDATAKVAVAAGITVVPAPELPEGWLGKTWACSEGVKATTGGILIFLDADVTLAPDALASLLATWSQQGGLLSVQPHHVICRPAESISLPFNLVALMGIGVGSVVPPRQGWAAAGPCLVTSRTDYLEVGGHRSVRNEVAEDLALARRYTAAAKPVRCFAGRDLVQFRMYRTLGAAVEGWRKNLATGARSMPRLRAITVAIWVTGMLVAAGMLTDLVGPARVAVPAAITYVAVTVQFAVLGRQVGRFGSAALVWPVLLAGFVAVFAWSAVSTFLSRRVRWSGRTVQIRQSH